MGRAPCCDKANVKKGPWSPEEDAKLKDYIQQFGTGGNWIALPQKAGLKRCGKSCRLRWLNYLRPNIKHGEFSDEEDRIICSLYANIGSRWSIIAAQLPGRTDNDIKNYWNTKLKKKLMMGTMINNTITSPNSIINPKKSLLNHHNPHNNSLMFHQYNQFPSSLLSSPSSLLSSPHHNVVSPSPSPSYQCTSTHYSNSPMTMSFTEGCYNNNNNSSSSNNNTLILMQNQHQVKDNSTLLVFGDQVQPQPQPQPSSCSSDGSCSATQMINNNNPVKIEDHQNYGVQLNDHHLRRRQEDYPRRRCDDHQLGEASALEHDIELLVDQKPSSGVTENNVGVWGQNGHSLLDYGLEEIKQLISTNFFDETKAAEKDTKVMYYYY